MENKQSIFHKDFILVVIGQIISLFGNNILRFALPLYLLNQTGSSALFGMISAVAFIPMIVLCPIGGLIADRVNKKNIMVILDFTTAALTILFCIGLGKVDIVPLLAAFMIILYGIQGTYQPAVQASIPLMLDRDHVMQGNAIINIVNSLAGLIGPVIGGSVYSFVGLSPILYVSIVCFIFSAIMEIFIHIPVVKQQQQGRFFQVAVNDLKESMHFICKKKPVVLKASLIIAVFNMFVSALIIIGTPVIITQHLGFETGTANRLYGFLQGVSAVGSLAGGLLATVCAKKIKLRHANVFIIISSAGIFPMGLAILFLTKMPAYIVILVTSGVIMIAAAMFMIQMTSGLQVITPDHLLGKVISCVMFIGMCASPIGQIVYGALFQKFSHMPYILFFVASIITTFVTLATRKVYIEIENEVERCEQA